MKLPLTAAALAMTLLVACKDEEETSAAASACTMEDLQAKATQVAEGLQANPSMVQELMGTMQDLAPQLQAAVTSGEISDEVLSELCAAYDELIEKF